MGSVTLASLGPLGDELGAGGQGTVYALPRSQSPSLVYKAYAPDVLSHLDTSVLSDMIALPAGLPGRDRQELMAAAAWPREAVTDGGRVCGFTMALVPRRFHTSIRLLKGSQVRLGQTQLLLNPQEYLERVAVEIDDEFRLDLLADIAGTLRLFHRLGLTVGDMSPNNLLYSRTGKPRCHFIDCDAMQLHGRTVLPQVETTDWEMPAGGKALGTKDSDTYKFALFCVRLFAGDQSTMDPEALRRAGSGVHSLAVRALSNGAAGPGLGKWEQELRKEASRPPRKTVTVPPRKPVTNTVTMPWPRTPVTQAARPAPAHPRAVPPTPRPPGILTRLARRLAAARRRTVIRLVVLSLLGAYALTHTAQIESWLQDAAKVVSDLGESDSQTQADGIAAVLASSAPVRTKVKGAVTNLVACKNLKSSVSSLGAASAARKRSLTAANGLEVTALSQGASLKAQLVSAFKHSKAADDAYRAWGVKLTKQGCRKSVRSGPDRGRGDKESAASTKAKQQFAKIWNQVGPAYGHRKVSYQDI